MQVTNHSGAVALLAGLVLLLAGCSGSTEEPAGLATSDPPPATTASAPAASPTPETTPAETPQTTGSTDDRAETADAEVAELEALYLEYWDVVADLWKDPRIEVDPMLEVATDSRTERMMGYISSELIANDARRDGELEFSNITVTIDGDEAIIEACMDQSGLKLIADGTEVPIDLSEVRPVVAVVIKQDGRWLVDETRGPADESINC